MVALFKPNTARMKPPAKIKAAAFDRMVADCNKPQKAPAELRARLAEARRLIREPA